ncbi:MAG: hypothetical protein AAF449_16175, partial [Myxococcota bacterium]
MSLDTRKGLCHNTIPGGTVFDEPIAWTTLAELLRQRGRDNPDETAFTFLSDRGQRQQRTFEQIETRADRVAAALAQKNLRQKPVLLLFASSLDY